MEFDGPAEEEKQEENPYEETSDGRRSSISSSDSSKHSKRIIEFDEDDQIIEAKPGSTFEMVDLKAKPTANQLMREFNPSEAGSYSQKKRDKRKRQKQRDDELKAIEETQRREKAYLAAKKQAEKSRKPGHFDRFGVTEDGSIKAQ